MSKQFDILNKMSVEVFIPARFASKRLPGKPLAVIGGRPMIEWVYERATGARLVDSVTVATDDERIREAVIAFGGSVVMTGEHSSGTERIAEAVGKADSKADIIVNVQGDEPLIEPENDKRGCGIPEGHPPLNAFLGLPCYIKNKLVGMVAIANRPGGYDEEIIKLLSPLVSTTANIIEAFRNDIKRKETEEALKLSEANALARFEDLNHIYATSPVGLSYVDSELRYVRINRKLAEMNGLSVEDHIGKTVMEILPEIVDLVVPPYRKVIETGEELSFEVQGETAAEPGMQHTWLVNYYPRKSIDGRVKGVTAVVQDITERKRAEEILKETKERFKIAQEVVQVGTWDWRPDSGDLYWTDEMFKIFGLKPNEVKPTYELFFERVHPDDRERLQEAVTDALESKKTFNMDFRIIKKDGRIIDTNAQGDVHFDEEGKPVRMLGLMQDITERKRAGEALEESEKLLSFAQKIAHLGHWKLDPATNEVTGSNELYRIFGITREEATLENFVEVVHPDDREFDVSTIKKGLEYGEDWDIEHRLILKDGTEKTVHAIGNAITDETGKTIQLIGTVQDITDRAHIEADRLKMQKLESIGVLAGGIAHDFNNLLTGILGNISLSMMGLDEGDKLFKRLKEAEKASFFARDLTQQLLTFSKGGAPIMVTLPIDKLIKEPAQLALRGSDKSYAFEIPNGLPSINADKGQIGQVINNLVINADQAMVKGGVINISAAKVSIDTNDHLPLKDGDYIVIQVADKGMGIAPENISKVFDPYFTTKQKGSGLGLASVYSIIKNHSGHIELTSEVGIGTTFSIYLPVSKAEAVKESKKEEEIIKGHGRVLVMDDEEIIRELLGEFLSQLGYSPENAPDGLSAARAYSEAKEDGKPFTAVIMDLTIQGGVGGKEAIKMILEKDPKAKVIVSSGYSNDPVVANFREFGFCGYLNKPYKVRMLSKVLDEVIKNPKD